MSLQRSVLLKRRSAGVYTDYQPGLGGFTALCLLFPAGTLSGGWQRNSTPRLAF